MCIYQIDYILYTYRVIMCVCVGVKPPWPALSVADLKYIVNMSDRRKCCQWNCNFDINISSYLAITYSA